MILILDHDCCKISHLVIFYVVEPLNLLVF